MRRGFLLLLLLAFAGAAAYAHVGSKDVYQEVHAGPYQLFVTIRMPNVIPGVATIEVRSTGAPASTIEITPLPLVGEASKHPPTPDAMQPSSADPAFYTGSLWMMGFGSWQVRFHVIGAAGEATTAVPVPATAVSTLKMDRKLGVVLALLGLFLVVTMAGIAGAAVGEARLPPGVEPPPSRRRRALVAATATLGFMALLLWGGSAWWSAEAADYAHDVYHPPVVRAALSGNQLDLRVETATAADLWENPLKKTLLPDHGYIMHLYAVREPEMDAAYHLHPALVGDSDFRLALPAMPAGTYKLYGDVVHANGFPETLQTTVTIPEGMAGGTLSPEDASAHPKPLDQGLLGTTYALPDGYSMRWSAPPVLEADKAYAFRFTLLDPSGQPAAHMEPYLGMAGHAAFVDTDGTVFAHTHPEGSAAMPALMMAQGEGSMSTMGSGGPTVPLSPTVEFPYGFPKPGRYRIFVQMKHDATVETGVFDSMVR